jgi:hypothetical protein
MWPYWLLTALLVLVLVCLGIVAWQRDAARMDADALRAELAGYRSRARAGSGDQP